MQIGIGSDATHLSALRKSGSAMIPQSITLMQILPFEMYERGNVNACHDTIRHILYKSDYRQ